MLRMVARRFLGITIAPSFWGARDRPFEAHAAQPQPHVMEYGCAGTLGTLGTQKYLLRLRKINITTVTSHHPESCIVRQVAVA